MIDEVNADVLRELTPQKFPCRVGTAHRGRPRWAVPTLRETGRPMRETFRGSTWPRAEGLFLLIEPEPKAVILFCLLVFGKLDRP